MPADQSRSIELIRTDHGVELTVQGVRRVFVADQGGDPWADALRYLHRMATVLDGPVRVRTADAGGARFLVVTPAGECYDESDPGSRSMVPGAAAVPVGAGPTADWLPGGEAAVRRTSAPTGAVGAVHRRGPPRRPRRRVPLLIGAVTAVALGAAGLVAVTQAGDRAPATLPEAAPRAVTTPTPATAQAPRPSPAPTAGLEPAIVPGTTFFPQAAGDGRRTPTAAPSSPSATPPRTATSPPAPTRPPEPAQPPPTRAPQPGPPEPDPDRKPERKPKPEPQPEREPKQEVSVPPSPIDPLAP